MRIHGGEARGRRLKTREGKGTRPTDARARETLFNILGERVVDARVLDLYAGTGAVGLEALSHGAQSCLFVEQNAVACRVIRENLQVLGWRTRARVWQNAVRPALRRIVESGGNASDVEEDSATKEAIARPHEYSYEAFDLVFADPPFTRPEELKELMIGLDNAGELLHNVDDRPDGLLVVQHHWKAVLPPLQRFEAGQSRRAGESLLSFFHPRST